MVYSHDTDTPLAHAFAATIYRVTMNPAIDLYVDHPAPATILEWCRCVAGVPDGWIITADNPGASAHSATDNRSRSVALDAELASAGLSSIATRHIDPAGRWPDEYGRLVATGDTAFMHALAIRFGQAAIVSVAHDQCRLVWID